MSDVTAPDHPRVRISWDVPIWQIAGFLAQAIAIAWWASSINARVAALEVANQGNQATPATVARLDERSKSQSDALTRIEARLDTLEHAK